MCESPWYEYAANCSKLFGKRLIYMEYEIILMFEVIRILLKNRNIDTCIVHVEQECMHNIQSFNNLFTDQQVLF